MIRRASLFAAAIILFASPQRATGASPAAPLVVVGVDGMTFEVIDALIAQGRLPTVKKLMQNGARAELISEKPMRSPALWTTIATGQPRRVHRIYDFVTGSGYWPRKERSKDQHLVTSDMRESPALWSMLTESARQSLIVGWLNTWPAEKIDGVMVAPYVALGERRQTSIKGKIYDDVRRQTYPADAFERVRAQLITADTTSPEEIARLVDEAAIPAELFKAVPKLRRYLYTVRWSIASTLSNTAIAEAELNRGDYDLVMTYFDGADTLAHRFWLMRQPPEEIRERLTLHGFDPKHAEALKEHLSGVIDGYYDLVDRMLARLLKAAGPDATLMVVSDHGWGALPKGQKAPHAHVPFDGEHRMEGVFIAQGPHIDHGVFAPLTHYDIVPTVLYLLGEKVPGRLPGKVATEIVDDRFIADHPPLVMAAKRPPKKEPKTPAAPKNEETPAFGEKELERLRSLGYVQ